MRYETICLHYDVGVRSHQRIIIGCDICMGIRPTIPLPLCIIRAECRSDVLSSPISEDEMSSNKKKLCCECIHWEMGDTWQTNPVCKPNVPVVISEGWCVSPDRKRPKQKWSHCPACTHFDEAPRMGFIVCGEGEPTYEVMEEIIQKTKELIER